MKELHQTDVDGVPCFWVDSGRPTLTASLIFRAGMVDETFASRGRTHLLEHLCLHGAGGGALQVNGSVSMLNTSFDTHGPIDQVAGHLTSIASWLAAPRFDNLGHEIQILQAEGRTRGSSAIGDALLWRYGARGPGLVAVDEFGLATATDSALMSWASTIFTARNAVLALDGPPPSGLTLALPPGDHLRPTPDADECPMPYPAMYRAPGLILTGVTTRSVAATLLPALLEKLVRDRFRHQEAAAYAPWSHYEAIDRARALIVAGTDLSPDAIPQAAHTLREIMATIANDGPQDADLADVVAALAQGMRDPYAAPAFAWRVAHRYLQGHPIESAEQAVSEVEAVTVDEIREAAVGMADGALIGAPEGAETPFGYTELKRPVPRPLQGTMFKSFNWPDDRSRLTINDQAIQIGNRSTRAGVDFADVVGMLKFRDGVRTLVGEDGWNITLDARVWDGGHRAVELVDERIHPSLHVQPLHDDPGEPPVRSSATRRWWRAFRQALRTERALIIYIAILSIFTVVLVAAGVVIAALLVGSGIYGASRELREVRAERQRSDPVS